MPTWVRPAPMTIAIAALILVALEPVYGVILVVVAFLLWRLHRLRLRRRRRIDRRR